MKVFSTSNCLMLCAVLISNARTALADTILTDLPNSRAANPTPKRVAIIGAGAAGTSTAYHLAHYSNTTALPHGLPPNITIYERAPYIGGRSTTVDAWDVPGVAVELGASVFVSKNRILFDAVAALNLTTTAFSRSAAANPDNDNAANDVAADSDGHDETLGIWDGRAFLFTMPTGSSRRAGGRWKQWWATARLLWRYGVLAPRRTMALMEATVGAFLQLYELPLFPWRSLSEAAAATGLLRATGATGAQFLETRGVGGVGGGGGLFAREVVQAATRVNYAQALGAIHALEALVCMATEGAVGVRGGNWRIFDGWVREAGAAARLGTEVRGLRRREEKRGTVVWEVTSWDAAGEAMVEEFDVVVVAAPWQYAGLSVANAPGLHVPDEIPYVTLHVTLFASPRRLAPQAFGLGVGVRVPDVILTTLPSEDEKGGGAPIEGLGPDDIFSISILRTALNPGVSPPRAEYIYKIFSPRPIEDSFLEMILGVGNAQKAAGLDKDDVSWVYRKEWKSYPYLYPRVTFEELQLDEGLWYTSGIESFISTMETSSLMGKNIARLIVDEWEDAGGDDKAAVPLENHAQQIPLNSEL